MAKRKKPGLAKRAKRLVRQIGEAGAWYAEEQKRKAESARKAIAAKKSAYTSVQQKPAMKKKKDWADNENKAARKIIDGLRDAGVSDTDIKGLLDK